MRLKATPENRVIAAVLPAVKQYLDPMRNDIGMADYGSGRVPYGVGGKGGSDYLCIIRPPHKWAGRWCVIEFKRPGGKPDLIKLDKRIAALDYCPESAHCKHGRCKLCYQRLFHLRVIRSSGIALFADCVQDVLRALEIDARAL